MPSFKDVHEYSEFAAAPREKRRFIQTKAIANFLQCVSDGGKGREAKLSAGKALWRAQIGSRDCTEGTSKAPGQQRKRCDANEPSPSINSA